MSTGHLTDELVEGYRARALRPDDLRAVGEHLALCANCRARVTPAGAADRLAEALGGEEHLSFEALEAIVRKGGPAGGHVERCSACAAEWRDLRAFHDSRGGTGKPWPRIRWMVPAAAFALAATILTAVYLRPRGVPVEPTLVSLRDGDRVLSMDRSGRWGGLDGMPTQTRADVEQVLRSGRLPVAPPEAALRRSRETQLGEPVAAATLSPMVPAGEAILTDTPAFRWRAPRDARDFRIEVYDAAFEPVERSPTLQGTAWISTKALRRGQVYSWTVSAMVSGTRVTAPHAPEPEALFRVASLEEARQMEEARTAVPVSQLRIATTAARLGFRDEARAALEQLRAANPQSPLAQRMLSGSGK